MFFFWLGGNGIIFKDIVQIKPWLINNKQCCTHSFVCTTFFLCIKRVKQQFILHIKYINMQPFIKNYYSQQTTTISCLFLLDKMYAKGPEVTETTNVSPPNLQIITSCTCNSLIILNSQDTNTTVNNVYMG